MGWSKGCNLESDDVMGEKEVVSRGVQHVKIMSPLPLPPQALSERANLREEYMLWAQHRESSPHALLSLCQMPYLLNPEAKSRILRGEAMAQQQNTMAAATMQVRRCAVYCYAVPLHYAALLC